MVKNNKNINILKKKGLISTIRQHGIRRINPKTILALEDYLQSILKKVTTSAKQEMTIRGSKTLKKTDIKSAIKQIEEKEDSWEIN